MLEASPVAFKQTQVVKEEQVWGFTSVSLYLHL